jgi:hypothetical protein
MRRHAPLIPRTPRHPHGPLGRRSHPASRRDYFSLITDHLSLVTFFLVPRPGPRHNPPGKTPQISLRRMSWSPRQAAWICRDRDECNGAGVGESKGRADER